MEHLKKIIKEEVPKLTELEMSLFKDSIENMFNNLIESISQKHERIEENIKNSFEGLDNSFSFYSTIVSVNEINYYDGILFPLIDEKNRYDFDKILKNIKDNNEIKLGKILYFEEKLLDEEREFQGKIFSENQSFKIRFKLIRFDGYREEVKKLYNYSKNNFFSWTTPNMPFLNSFFEIELSYADEEVYKIEEIKNITFDFEELEEKIKFNFCPLWSIEKIHKITSMDAIWIGENKYRYKTGINNLEKTIFINNNYKIHGLDYDEKNILEITIDKSNLKELSCYIIKKNNEIPIKNNIYPLWTNNKRLTFVSGFNNRFNNRIRSIGEIRRILLTMEGAKGFNLVEVKVFPKKDYENKTCTFEINSFIEKDIRNEETKELMILTFECNEIKEFLLGELSYIISEFQIYFPEYRCVGELI